MPCVTDEGIALIKRFEGCRLTPYRDANGFWTVGWGHKLRPGDNIAPKDTITQAKADLLFEDDLDEKADAVEDLLEVDVNDNQFSALVSFAFNEGEGRLRDSTLLEKLNAGHARGAADEFDRWVFAGGEPQKGLILRRAAEKVLFLKPDFQGGHNED